MFNGTPGKLTSGDLTIKMKKISFVKKMKKTLSLWCGEMCGSVIPFLPCLLA